MVIVNVENLWAPLKGLLDHMREEAFIRPGLEVRVSMVATADEIVPFLQQAFAAGAGEVADEATIDKL